MATSATSSATASIVSSLGGGSGINMAELASNLAVAQFANRTDRLAAKSETLDKQISAASNLKSMLLGLTTSFADRLRSGDLSPQPQIANGAIARLSLSGTTPPSGSYALEVGSLATGQVLASPAFASSAAPVGSGTLRLRFGTVGAGTFSEDTARAPVEIAIPAGATLADAASAINASGSGVTAYVAQTGTGAKLVLKGAEGAANGFVLEAEETPGDPGLAALAWQPATGDPARLTAPAANAAFTIDGVAMTSTTNRIDDAVPGLSITLTGSNTGAPTQITFADASASIGSVMQDLTSALNEIAGELATLTKPPSGELARDSGAIALKRALSSLAGTVVMPNAPAGAPRTLADLGLSTQRDGTFALEGKRLSATLAAAPKAAAAMFTTGFYGVYATIDSVARAASKTTSPSSLGASISRYGAQKTQATSDLAKLSEQQEKLRTQLVARFAATDSRVGASKATLSFLQNQIDAWNAPRD